MQNIEPFLEGNCYHVFNRGINSCDIFTEPDNYRYFLSLYERYVQIIADTYAWVLMPNHFHFLVNLTPARVLNPDGRKVTPSIQLSRVFNSYAQAFNKRNDRHGSLFERPFKRILIEDESYLRDLVVYIHNNPVKHGFVKKPEDYLHSSYTSYLNMSDKEIAENEVIGWFDDIDNFRFVHEEPIPPSGLKP